MNCPRCGYLLFNLPRPQCPECGEHFDVARYRFAPGSVSFHCPGCDQAYYGNDDRGLPWPREFDCVQCGRHVSLQQLRVVPRTPDARGWAGSTWDERRRLGFWRAWWDTTKSLLLHPAAFFRSHSGTSILEAYLYSVVCAYIGLTPLIIFEAVFTIGLMNAMVGAGMPTPPPWWIFCIAFAFLGAVIPALVPLIGGAIATITIHLALLVLARERRSIDYTFRTVLYSYGTTVIFAIPVCGSNAGAIWQIVTLVIGLREVHRIGAVRAVIAVLWPLAILVPAYIAFVVLLIYRAH